MSDAETLAPPKLSELFALMAGRRVLVIGDAMIDEWIRGDSSRISPEAPVPVVTVSSHDFTLGGAANVANNLRALGAQVSFIGLVGNDEGAELLRKKLAEKNIDPNDLVTSKDWDRPTTRKTRIVARGQQVVRADWEKATPISAQDHKLVEPAVRLKAKTADAVVLSDYAKGFFTTEIVEAAKESEITVADPKPKNLHLFSGVTCIAPNVNEAAVATGIDIVDDETLERAGAALLKKLGTRYVIITRHSAGMSLFGSDGERATVPSVARTVFDVSGAGDTAVAVLSLALAADIPIKVAMQLANYAAGAVVEKLGTATVSAAEVIALVEHGRT
jgi:D-beta-D-heptose 7-phosphate kinase/D-beta-D-heptose 1-phosphate adenosyltransferase